MIDARFHAFKILYSYHKDKIQLSAARDAYFAVAVVPKRDRQRVFVLTNEIIRFQGRLDSIISKACDRSPVSLDIEVLIVLQIAAYELLMDDRTPDYAAISTAVNLIERIKGNRPKGFVNASCRNIQKIGSIKKTDFLTPSDWYSVPKWMFTRWTKRYGIEKTGELCDYFNLPSKMTIRRNADRVSEEELFKDFENNNIILIKINGSDLFYNVEKGGASLFTTESFKIGAVSVQDRAAGAIVEVLDPQPGDTVLDVCAAPGTKSLYIAEKVGEKGKIFAFDKDPDRVVKGKIDSNRHSYENIIWEVKDAETSEYPLADKILIDVPCSGTGVIQRRPDIRWHREHGDIRLFAETQKAILNNVKQFVKPGGVIVYATCSMEPEENWSIVNSFLKLNENFTVEKITDPDLKELVNEEGHLETFPPENHMDGMYAVKLRLNK